LLKIQIFWGVPSH